MSLQAQIASVRSEAGSVVQGARNHASRGFVLSAMCFAFAIVAYLVDGPWFAVASACVGAVVAMMARDLSRRADELAADLCMPPFVKPLSDRHAVGE